jgi:hypothetical protein
MVLLILQGSLSVIKSLILSSTCQLSKMADRPTVAQVTGVSRVIRTPYDQQAPALLFPHLLLKENKVGLIALTHQLVSITRRFKSSLDVLEPARDRLLKALQAMKHVVPSFHHALMPGLRYRPNSRSPMPDAPFGPVWSHTTAVKLQIQGARSEVCGQVMAPIRHWLFTHAEVALPLVACALRSLLNEPLITPAEAGELWSLLDDLGVALRFFQDKDWASTILDVPMPANRTAWIEFLNRNMYTLMDVTVADFNDITTVHKMGLSEDSWDGLLSISDTIYATPGVIALLESQEGSFLATDFKFKDVDMAWLAAALSKAATDLVPPKGVSPPPSPTFSPGHLLEGFQVSLMVRAQSSQDFVSFPTGAKLGLSPSIILQSSLLSPTQVADDAQSSQGSVADRLGEAAVADVRRSVTPDELMSPAQVHNPLLAERLELEVPAAQGGTLSPMSAAAAAVPTSPRNNSEEGEESSSGSGTPPRQVPGYGNPY